MPKARMLQFLEQPPFARTHPSARSVLAPEPLNGTNGTRYRVAEYQKANVMSSVSNSSDSVVTNTFTLEADF
jgi:hypothetical protein